MFNGKIKVIMTLKNPGIFISVTEYTYNADGTFDKTVIKNMINFVTTLQYFYKVIVSVTR